MTTHQFHPDILREYDIRGTIGDNLTEADAYHLGRAFGTQVVRDGGNKVSVGYDGRESSPPLTKELTRGLAESGVNVELVGLGPSPMLYFAVKDHLTDGGIMVTGSHNPGDMNGFKMLRQSGPIYGEAIKALAALSEAGDYESGEGSIREIDIKDTYVERLLRDMVIDKPIKIAWDAGHGAAGAVLHQLVAKLPGDHILLYDTVDGSFPAHHPDPTVDENLKDLQRVVTEQGCDLGIAFDGDGDRIGVVDDRGRIIRCDMLLALYARFVLEDLPGSAIVADVKCSNALFEEIKKRGGRPIMWKTGHSLIKSKMAELNAPLAGELSGHIFFADKYYGFDDALYCAVRLIHHWLQSSSSEKDKASEDEPASSNAGKFSELVEDLPRPVNTPELRLPCPEDRKFKLVERIKSYLHEHMPDKDRINETDGVRVTLDSGWWLIRASNTQPAIVARAEANNKEALEEVRSHMDMVLSIAAEQNGG